MSSKLWISFILYPPSSTIIHTRRRDTSGTLRIGGERGAKISGDEAGDAGGAAEATSGKKAGLRKNRLRARVGYRRNATAGTWVVRAADGQGGNWTKAIGTADDFDEADGKTVLDFWQAQDRARVISRVGRDGDGDEGRPATIAEALDRYEADLETRGGDTGNVARVRAHLPGVLAGKSVALVTAHDLRAWRDRLAKELAASTVNRTANGLKAALNLIADHDERIPSRRAWENGLASLHDAEESRNVILPETAVRTIIGKANEQSVEFGLLVEVAAVTGARMSQLARLEVQDLQDGRTDPRLMMPSSRKGRGKKKIERRPVSIPAGLATKLRGIVNDRPLGAALLVKPSPEAPHASGEEPAACHGKNRITPDASRGS